MNKCMDTQLLVCVSACPKPFLLGGSAHLHPPFCSLPRSHKQISVGFLFLLVLIPWTHVPKRENSKEALAKCLHLIAREWIFVTPSALLD